MTGPGTGAHFLKLTDETVVLDELAGRPSSPGNVRTREGAALADVPGA